MLKKVLFGLAAGSTLLFATPVGAIDILSDACSTNPDSATCRSQNDNAESMVSSVMNILFGVIALVAVIMIVIGGFRYAVSSGDPSKTKSAKDTILYSVIGLVVAVASFMIVNFLVRSL